MLYISGIIDDDVYNSVLLGAGDSIASSIKLLCVCMVLSKINMCYSACVLRT